MKVLFVCTDNFVRSVIAEQCFNDYVLRNRIEGWESLSAGLRAKSDTSKFSTAHLDRLREWNIGPSEHRRRQVDDRLLREADLIVAMGTEHKEYIERKFSRPVSLFNEIVKGEFTSVMMDASDEIDIAEKLRRLTDEIYQATPCFVKNVQKHFNKFRKEAYGDVFD